MADTTVKYVQRNWIVDRDTYLRMRQDQIAIMDDARHQTITKEVNRLYQEWLTKRPPDVVKASFGSKFKDQLEEQRAAHNEWRKQRPETPYFLNHPREMNIVYSMIRGKTYSQVEPKVREHNEPDLECIKALCQYYGFGGRTIIRDIGCHFNTDYRDKWSHLWVEATLHG